MTKDELIEHIAALDPFPGWELEKIYPYVSNHISRLEFDMLFTLHSPSILHAFQQLLLGKIRAYALENIEANSGMTHTIKSLIYKHFEHLNLYKSAEFAAIQSCSHLPDKLSFPLQLSNLIWELAGDTSTDMNYYSKRLILAGIYTATLLYWYKNNGPLSDVMAFFDQRLKNHISLINKGKEAKNSLKGIKKNVQFLRDYFSTN